MLVWSWAEVSVQADRTIEPILCFFVYAASVFAARFAPVALVGECSIPVV